jgi:hypothetical protein
MEPQQTKTCTTCNLTCVGLDEIKANFHKSGTYFRSECRACHKEAYGEANKKRSAKRRAKRKEQKFCVDCGKKSAIKNGTRCVLHTIGLRVRTQARETGDLEAIKDNIESIIQATVDTWYKQGGQPDGTGATCFNTGTKINLSSCEIGHKVDRNTLTGLARWASSNVGFQCAHNNQMQTERGCNPDPTDRWRGMGSQAVERYNEQHDKSLKTTGGGALKVILKAIYHSQPDWTCIYSGRPISIDDCSLSLDHIVPLKRGGTNSLSNLQFISRGANSPTGKGSKFHSEYALEVDKSGLEPDPLSNYLEPDLQAEIEAFLELAYTGQISLRSSEYKSQIDKLCAKVKSQSQL